MLGQCLLPLAASWSFRPKPVSRVDPKRPDGEPLHFLFRYYEAAVRFSILPVPNSHPKKCAVAVSA